MRTRLLLQLGLMMFLQYAVWGSWMPILSGTLNSRGIAPDQIGNVYAAMWATCAISPFLGGQIVDRFMPSQIFVGISHLLAAGAAFMMSTQTEAGGLIMWMAIWGLLFSPTLAITNAIAFFHIDKIETEESLRERTFARIRTMGTIGWIVAAFVLAAFTQIINADPKGIVGPITEMRLTALLGVVMGIFSFLLPNTPPSKAPQKDALAIRKAFSLFKTVPGFGVFMFISFFAATEFQFFYGLSAQFLGSKEIPHSLIPILKTISQVAEIGALAILLPMWLPSKGMRWCLLLGSFAWPLRYLIFAIGDPVWLVVLSLGLHGFGYAFVLVVQQLYVDRVATKDIRASAQSLLTFVTLGVGNVLGSIFAGKVQAYFTHQVDGKSITNWAPVFILPTVTTVICALAYMATFKNPVSSEEPETA